ncbi:MAG TPA: AsmA-like C-terminal domain-containing protein, partial [Nitrospirales bacterium]|nr:AsmA-like C-terminal domain-containing protein [Nitrospirales bacterium]
LAADLALRGTLGELKTWRAQGRLALSDIAVRASGGAAIERLTLNLTGDSGTLDARVTVAAQPLAIHGGIVRWRGEPSITVGVEAGAIDVTRLKDGVAAESDARGTDHPTAAPELPASAVTIVLKRLTYGRLVLSDASIRASVRDTVLRLHRFSADTERGHLDAEGEIDWGRAGTWRISWFATGIGVEPLAESLFASSGELSGWLSSSGGLSGTLREGTAALASTCDIEALIEHGRVRRLAGISQILALVNLPSTVVNHVDLASRGLPFDRLKVVASIRDRRVQVRRAFLDSPIIKASAVGSYDIAENRLASTVAVSPLGSYVSLLSKLPVFDTLLDGDRDTLARAIFEVKGSMLAPTVRFLPLNSLEGSVAGVASLAFDVLRNGVRLPKELLTLSHRPRQAADAGAIDHCSGALS